MDCPYCAEAVKDEAIVCRHCGRDLFVIRPLMEQLAEAKARLEAYEAASPGEQPAIARPRARSAADAGLPGIDAISAVLLTFIALVVAHYLIIMVYSLPLLFLRIVSIGLPLVFGFLCRQGRSQTMVFEFFYGVVVAAAAILVMAFIVGKIDNVPVLPRNFVEWREFAEYGASIAFGFFTGVVLRQTLIAMRSNAPPNRLIRLTSKVISDKLGGAKVGFNIRTIHTLVSTVVAAASGITSVITGLSQFF